MDDLKAMGAARLRGLRDELAGALPGLADFTPGSFQSEMFKCGKQNCHCQTDGDPGHGPRFAVLRYERGKTVKTTVPSRLAEEFRGRVGVWDGFKAASSRLADVNAELSRRLAAGEETGQADPPGAGGEKGGSTRRAAWRDS
jgi:hypothetical protein